MESDIEAAVESLINSFAIEKPIDNALQTKDDIRKLLSQRITQLLSEKPERLMSMLYRFDVSEVKIHEVFSTSFPFDIPDKITELVLERQFQKMRTRKLYAESRDASNEL